MKLITTTAMFLLFCFSYAQDKNCKIQKKYDEFTEVTDYKTQTFDISKQRYGLPNPGEIQFFKSEYKSGTIFYSMMVSGNKEGCVTKNAGVILLFKTGQKISIYTNNNSINCGRSFIIVPLSKEDIEELSKNVIDKVRIDYDGANEDFTFTEKAQTKFLENLNCITSAK